MTDVRRDTHGTHRRTCRQTPTETDTEIRSVRRDTDDSETDRHTIVETEEWENNDRRPFVCVTEEIRNNTTWLVFRWSLSTDYYAWQKIVFEGNTCDSETTLGSRPILIISVLGLSCQIFPSFTVRNESDMRFVQIYLLPCLFIVDLLPTLIIYQRKI